MPFPFKRFSLTPLQLCRTPIVTDIRDFHPYSQVCNPTWGQSLNIYPRLITYDLCIRQGTLLHEPPLLSTQDFVLMPSLRCFRFRTVIQQFPLYCGVRLQALPAIKHIQVTYHYATRQSFAFITDINPSLAFSIVIPGEIDLKILDTSDIVCESFKLYPRRDHILLLYPNRIGVGHFCLPLQFHCQIIFADQSTSSPCT